MKERNESTPFKPEDNGGLIRLRNSYLNGLTSEITNYLAQDTQLIYDVNSYLKSDRSQTEVSITEQVRLLYNTLKNVVISDPLADVMFEDDLVITKTYIRDFHISPTQSITVTYSQFVDESEGNILILQSSTQEFEERELEYCLMDDGSFAVNAVSNSGNLDPDTIQHIATHTPMHPERTPEEIQQMIYSCTDLVMPLIGHYSQQ